MDLRKAYYYIICLAALFVLAWGLVDLSSATIGLAANRAATPSIEQPALVPGDKESEPYLEMYYQKKMLYDRFWDSLSRLVVAGAIFAYCRAKVDRV